jgi:hypothetical protein
MPIKLNKPIKLNDDHCLLWVKDPSVSPFISRKNILTDEKLQNPKSFINKIRRKCFYNSALRHKIVEKIEEYKKSGLPRLYTINDKLSEKIEYMDPPFTEKECKEWVSNHLVNPRTNDLMQLASKRYIELVYTALHYDLPMPIEIDINSTDKYEQVSYKIISKIIINVKKRLQFMHENDEYFLKHNVESFDKKLKIASPILPVPIRKEKVNNTFGVSSSSSSHNKGLNSAERRQLRDLELEINEEKNLVAEYNYQKNFLPKKDVDKTIFDTFRKVINDFKIKVENGELIKKILENASVDAKARITVPVDVYLKKRYIEDFPTFIQKKHLDMADGIILEFLTNIYAKIENPSFKLLQDMEICTFSYENKKYIFKSAELINKITNVLFAFIEQYSFAQNDKIINNKIKSYFKNIVEDIISKDFVAKRKIETRPFVYNVYNYIKDYKNFYYNYLLSASEEPISKEPIKARLPEGMGLLIGKELTKAIEDLNEPYFNNSPDDRVITDDNGFNGFTYEECRNWVIMPVINPRTFERILIDSPMYNRLLCISFQYDTNLIPRMMTYRGYEIIKALPFAIDKILKRQGKIAQSRDQLEKYIRDKEAQYKDEKDKRGLVSNKIGLIWKNAGSKHPNAGVEIMNEKLTAAIKKSINSTNGPSFYVLFSEDELEKFGIATAIGKNSYVEIATYYIPVINSARNSKVYNSLRLQHSYYIPVVNSASNNKVGLKWKKISVRQQNEGIINEGIEIINKKLAAALLKLKDTEGETASSILFSEDDFAKFGITTKIAKNNYIKIINYYVPVVVKKDSDITIIKKASTSINSNTKDIKDNYNVNKYYTIVECMRWAQQPNRDPSTRDIILTDGDEYNTIFEQALLYDHNIQPINITPRGIRFRNKIFKTRNKFLTIAKDFKRETSKGKDISTINSTACKAFNNIYDDDTDEVGKQYKKLKLKMIERCEQYNKEPPLYMEDLQKSINENLLRNNKKYAKRYNLNYYQDSALASLLIFYNDKRTQIYNEEYRDIFLNNFDKFFIYIYEINVELKISRKNAIDEGGPRREFFTKLFEEFFCDEQHLTRPFIRPDDNKANTYYINPNFKPDDNFKKVIAAYKKEEADKMVENKKKKKYNKDALLQNFDTENDYEYIYYVIGKLLCIVVVNDDIGLPKQLSAYILAGLINQPKDINYYDLLYFYATEFKSGLPYINLISNDHIKKLDSCKFPFNNIYMISKSKGPSESSSELKITTENCIKFLLQQSKHVITKNFLIKEDANSNKNMTKRYASLFDGFSDKITVKSTGFSDENNDKIRTFLYKKRVTPAQLSLLITNEQLTPQILEELANKIQIEIKIKYMDENNIIYEEDEIDIIDDYEGPRMPLNEQRRRENELKGYMVNIITKKRDGETDKEHIEFIKKLLQFWTAFNYYIKNKDFNYTIHYKYGAEVDINRFPSAHTCFNILDIWGFPTMLYSQEEMELFKYDQQLFPNNLETPEEKETFLYDKLKWAVESQEMDLH